MKKFENDLTEGSVFKQLLWFAIPFFFSNLIQSLYSLTDLIILGNFGGTNAISAANVGGQVVVILTNLAAGFSVGGTVMLGNYLGSKQRERLSKTISTLLISLMVLAFSITIILLFFNDSLLRLLDTPAKAYKQTKQYLTICTLGLVFIYGYNALSAIMRGLGDSKTPMKFVSFACIINIVLDLVLVGGFKLGAAGAAGATVFAQACSMLFCIIYLKKNDFVFDFKLSSLKFDRKEFSTLIKTGLPLSIQHTSTNISFLILTYFVNRVGGAPASAATGIVNNFNGFAILPSVAVSSAAAAMISQNLGAGRIDRATKAMKYCIGIDYLISIAVFTLMNVFPGQIFALFGAEADVLEYGIPYIAAFSFEYATLPFIVGFNSISTGSGFGWVTMLTNMIASFIIRIPLAYIFAFKFGMGLVGIGYAIPVATCIGSFLAGLFYASGIWKKSVI